MNSKGCLFSKGRVKSVPVLGDYVSVLVNGSHTNQPNLGYELYTDTFKILSSTCLSSKSFFFNFALGHILSTIYRWTSSFEN